MAGRSGNVDARSISPVANRPNPSRSRTSAKNVDSPRDLQANAGGMEEVASQGEVPAIDDVCRVVSVA